MEYMNRLITNKYVDLVVNTLSTKKGQGDMTVPRKSTKHLRKNSPSTAQKIQKSGTHFSSFCKVSIIMIPKPDKDITPRKSYRPIFLMNMEGKILKKMPANTIH